MKTKRMLETLSCLLMTCLMGCSDSQTEIRPSLSEITIHAVQNGFNAQGQTKSVIGDIMPDGALVMDWGVRDEMGVFTTTGNNYKFVSTNTGPSAAADFQPETATGIQGEPVMGYYPYAAGNTDATAIAVTIPTTQEYSDANSIAGYDYKAAEITTGEGGKYLMKMKQIVTLLRFQINLNDIRTVLGTDFDASEKLDKVVLGTKTAISGKWKYNLNDVKGGQITLIPVETGNSLTLNFSGKPALGTSAGKDGNLTAYAIVGPGRQKGQKLECDLHTDRHVIRLTADIISDFKAGKFYTIPLNAKVFNNARETGNLTVEDKGTTPPGLPHPAENEETANCYIINTTGAHEFWGTQIGNGAKGIIKGAGFHTEDPYISPKSAKLLWQDVQDFISDISFNPQDGKVHYTANSTSGNAVIAVYDGENGTGNILWSWHIWGTGDEIPGNVELTNMAGARFMIMNRTLGAHSASSCLATLYQWGRKDPIPNSSVYYTEEGPNAEAKDIERSYPHLALETSTIVDGVQNPGQIITLKNLAEHDMGWTSEMNLKLWGDGDKAGRPWSDENPWGYKNPAAGAGWEYPKTIYDPSPAGYRVANMFTFTGFIRTDHDTWAQGSANRATQNHQDNFDHISCIKDYNKEEAVFNQGYLFKRNISDEQGVFFPMIGYRTSPSGDLFPSNWNSVGRQAHYWTSCSWKKTYTTPGAYEIYASGLTIGEYIRRNYTATCDKNQLKTVDDTERQLFLKGIRCVVDDATLVRTR